MNDRLPTTVVVPSVDASLIVQAERMRTRFSEVVIDSDGLYVDAGRDLATVKALFNTLEAAREHLKKPVLEAGRGIDNFFREPLGWLRDAEATIKRCMLGWDAKKEAERRAAQAVADELARVERERLAEQARAADEARMAAERLAAEHAAAAEAALTAAAEAAKAGDSTAFDKAKADANDAAVRANAATSDAMEQAAAAQALATTAAVMTAPVIEKALPKVAGVAQSSTITFEVTDKMALIRWVAANPAQAGLLTPDVVRLRAYVKAIGQQVLDTAGMPDAITIPGVAVRRVKSLSSRAA
jgi:colicin import membrane protein